jgi:hypothetical protein
VYYNDYDHVFLVSVQEVPRQGLPFDRPLVVGGVDDVQIVLKDVAIANHVELLLDAEEGQGKVAAIEAYRAEHERWMATAPDGVPPVWPATRLMEIAVNVVDDVGTDYQQSTGRAGGEGMEWELQLTFLPAPPTQARHLYLDFASPEAEPVRLELPLPGDQPPAP